ncbi:MAG: glucosaminidase domain-containing protein [Bacteroidales bacterium]|nr:glucosaminidase domain-containing protein [Bacteroidales bacterium]
MKKILTLSALLWICVTGFSQYTMEDRIYDYIDQYKDLAMREMELYKVPASITLAQAIYASKVGTNRQAVEANNHFGIMCHTSEWKGETFYETENHTPDYCFRKYASVEESYRDHSLFLSQRSRYVKLFYYPITDYKSWAYGLKEAGYSGNPRYADTLISIIEKYYLMHYDRKVAQKLGDTVALQKVNAPAPEMVTEAPKSEPTVATPAPKPEPVAKPTKPEKQPAAQPETPKNTTSSITEKPQPKAEEKKPEAKPVEKPAKNEPKAEPKPKETKPEPPAPAANAANAETYPNQLPNAAKVDGKNVFILDPYAVPFKQAYYPYTSRPVYENNKTRFIIAKRGDTYAKLAAAMQMSEKNLRAYNDVYDDSEPIEDEVIYLEMKSTKSSVEYHTLAAGDTYRYIAQKYGIQLKIIIKRNSGAISSYGAGDKICIGCK